MRKALKVALAVTAMATFLVVAGAAPAHADATAIDVGNGAGVVWWNADPFGDPQNPGSNVPGDAIKACDRKADGWGVKAYLDFNHDGDADRTATTQGHNSPYCTGWATGNLEEGISVAVWGCLAKGTEVKNCTGKKYFVA